MTTDDRMRRLYVQRVLAKCYVVMAEVDYDLREWRKSLVR